MSTPVSDEFGVVYVMGELVHWVARRSEIIVRERRLDTERQLTLALLHFLQELEGTALESELLARPSYITSFEELRGMVHRLSRWAELLAPKNIAEWESTLLWYMSEGENVDLARVQAALADPPFDTADARKALEDTLHVMEERLGKGTSAPSEVVPWHESWTAFRTALPDLTEALPGKWVAYRGAERVVVGDSKREVYRELAQHRESLDGVIVRRVPARD